MRVTGYAALVYDEQAWPLAQRERLALDVVPVKDTVIGVNQAGERDVVFDDVCLSVLQRVGCNNDDVGARIQERLVLVRQLTEMPSAEGSLEPPQEHEDHAALAPEVAERDLASPRGWQREVRSFRSNRYKPALNRHRTSSFDRRVWAWAICIAN